MVIIENKGARGSRNFASVKLINTNTMMSNKKTTYTIGATPVERKPNTVKPGQGYASHVLNLRPDPAKGLVPTGRPDCHTAMQASTPLGRLNTGEKHVFAGAAGRTLVTADASLPSATATSYPDVLPGEALCALQQGEQCLLAMTKGGAASIRAANGKVTAEKLSHDYPPIGLRARAGSPVSAEVAARTLSSTYGAGSRLSARDAGAVTGDLAEAYLRICADASAAGMAVQPVLARYKLRDSQGHILFTSAPVLLGPATGGQCGSSIDVYSDDRCSLRAYTLSADTWTMALDLPASTSGHDGKVATAEVYISPLFHAYNPDLPGEVNVGRGSSSADPFLRVRLPGASESLGGGGSARRTLMKAFSRMDAIEERVAVVSRPFGSSARTVSVALSPSADAAGVSRSLRTALAKAVRHITPAESWLREPHNFTAACCAAEASAVAWGNLRILPFEGYSAASLSTAADASKSWRAVTMVHFADGSAVVRTEEGASGAPTAFSPVLSYPSPEAVSMTISVTAGGVTRTATYTLSPEESGQAAVFIAEQASAMTLPTGAAPTAGAISAPEVEYAEMVAIAPSDNPLSPDIFCHAGSSAIKALVAKTGSDQSWEFGRSRFMAGSADGIFSIGVGKDRASMSVRKTTAAGVARNDAMVKGEDGEIFAIAGPEGSILRLGGTAKTEVYAAGADYYALGYDKTYGELWAFRTDGSAHVFCQAYDGGRYMRNDVAATSVTSIGDRTYAMTAEGLVALGKENARQATEVSVEYNFNTPNRQKLYAERTDWLAGAGQIRGTVALHAASIHGASEWPVASTSLEGECRSPLRMTTVSRPASHYVIKLDAMTDSTFFLNSIKLTFHG